MKNYAAFKNFMVFSFPVLLPALLLATFPAHSTVKEKNQVELVVRGYQNEKGEPITVAKPGDIVQIIGGNFGEGGEVKVNQSNAKILSWNEEYVTIKLPKHTKYSGPVHVTLTRIKKDTCEARGLWVKEE